MGAPNPLPSRRIRALTPEGEARVRRALALHYFSRGPADYLESSDGQRDLDDHVHERLRWDRERVVPWLAAARSLDGARILEIGCGTGCSTVALAEQGARVTAVDVDKDALRVAGERCAAYGLDIELVERNATEIAGALAGRRFDWVVFYASLEHMTHAERILAMQSTWRMLRPGDLWCVVETPNRLWHTDDHTSRLPYFHWLPDELAFAYARFSPRPNFREIYDRYDEASRLHFLRRGRGVSFHEFELAFGPREQLDVVSCLHLGPHDARWRGWIRRLRHRRDPSVRFRRLLAEITPDVHPGFLEPHLDLILRRSA